MLVRTILIQSFGICLLLGCGHGSQPPQGSLDSRFERIVDLSSTGNVASVKTAITELTDINATTSDGSSLLGYALMSGDRELVLLVLTAGADPNGNGLKEFGPLEFVANSRGDNVELLQTLLDAGAKADGADRNVLKPLHYAVMRGNYKCAELLLKSGANPNATSVSVGSTPLHIAAERAQVAGVDLLINNGASVTRRDRAGKTPHDVAVLALHSAKGSGAPKDFVQNLERIERTLRQPPKRETSDPK